jgi:chromosome segregation ATPase
MCCTPQDALEVAESEMTRLKDYLASQQTARSEAEDKYRTAVEELEKTQVDFALFKKNTESDQAAMTKRAEDAEGRLTVVSEELQTLKRHISRMTSAVFGKLQKLGRFPCC